MRILYLTPSANFGGAERVLFDLIATTRREAPACEVTVIAGEDGPLLADIREVGAITKVVPFSTLLALAGDSPGRVAGTRRYGAGKFARTIIEAVSALSYAWRLKRAIRQSSPDLVHASGAKMHLLSAISVPRNIPLVWHIHDYVSPRPLTSKLLRLTANRCSVAIGNSESVAADVRQLCPGIPEVIAIHYGIDLESFSPEGPHANLDELSGLPNGSATTVRIGLTGTMARWKGHEVFLNALATLPRELDWRGYIVGGPIYRSKESQHDPTHLKTYADQLGLGQRVGFTGFVKDAASAMRALDIVVHASTLPEPFGRVIAEGMACGRAVVASDLGGAAEIVSSGVDGLTHKPSDANGLARQLKLLAMNPSLRAKLGREGRITAERRFDRTMFVRKIVSIHQTLLEHSRIRRSGSSYEESVLPRA